MTQPWTEWKSCSMNLYCIVKYSQEILTHQFFGKCVCPASPPIVLSWEALELFGGNDDEGEKGDCEALLWTPKVPAEAEVLEPKVPEAGSREPNVPTGQLPKGVLLLLLLVNPSVFRRAWFFKILKYKFYFLVLKMKKSILKIRKNNYTFHFHLLNALIHHTSPGGAHPSKKLKSEKFRSREDLEWKEHWKSKSPTVWVQVQFSLLCSCLRPPLLYNWSLPSASAWYLNSKPGHIGIQDGCYL